MAEFPDGVPCWADVMLPDVEAAKHFYGQVFGWTFDEGSEQLGGYTPARSDGRRVAAVVPTPPEMTGFPPSWSVWFASSQVDEVARRVELAGGRRAVEPLDIPDCGRMMIAQDPQGTFFGVWQAGTHAGFEKRGEVGSYVWTDICVRETAAVDAFYPAVLPLKPVALTDREAAETDYAVFKVGDHAVAGRLRMDGRYPPGTPAHVLVYFGVHDCDRAVAVVRSLGGALRSGPVDSRFGRFAVVSDPQGAVFAVIDPTTTAGDAPQ